MLEKLIKLFKNKVVLIFSTIIYIEVSINP